MLAYQHECTVLDFEANVTDQSLCGKIEKSPKKLNSRFVFVFSDYLNIQKSILHQPKVEKIQLKFEVKGGKEKKEENHTQREYI